MTEFRTDIQALEHIEHKDKMVDFTKSHNLHIGSLSALEEEVIRLSNKVLDLEDCSRRNNIRVVTSGIFEPVPIGSYGPHAATVLLPQSDYSPYSPNTQAALSTSSGF